MELTRWAGAQARADESVAARRARNLISGTFLGFGALLAFLALLVLPGWQVDNRSILVVAGIALVGASVLQVVYASRVPVAMNHVASVVGTGSIALAQCLAGDPVAIATVGLLYVWVAVLTALFYSPSATAVHVGIMSVVQIAVLLWLDRPGLVPQVVLTVGTCVTAAFIVGWLTRDLRQQVSTDPLTKLANRRGLDTAFARELAVATRNVQPLCVAVLDLDGFKGLNDRDGHAAGDAVLIEAAEAWVKILRPTDTLARIGGDEFVVLLPDCTAERAQKILFRLLADTPASVSCSAGAAMYDGEQDAEAFLARADAAMYRAKADGGSTLVLDD